MAFLGTTKVDGAEELKKTLRGIDDRVRKQALRKGVNAGTGVVLRKAKSKVARRTKTLAKALGRKTRVYRGTVVGIVGPRTGRKVQVGVVKTGPNAGQPIYEIPTQVAHLVEKGTHRSRAQPFMRPALDESKSEATGAVADAVREQLKK